MKATALERELPEIKYLIKLGKNKAAFIWGSTPLLPSKSSIDLKVRVDPKELLSLAKELKIPADGDKIFVPNLDLYNRLLAYACVRPTLKEDVESMRRLVRVVLGMTGWDAHYWASAFRELWWEYGKYSRLRDLVKAFKLFFEVE